MAFADASPRFCTTSWTLVLACGDQSDSPAARDALAELYQTYWYPLYAYIRRRGYGEQDAEDLVQAFCAEVQAKHALSKADPMRGKFRTFLLSSLQNFLAHERDRANAQKRGGRVEFIRLDSDDASARYRAEPSHTATPEAIFEARWAHTLLEQTLGRLRADFAARGKERLFDALSSFLASNREEQSYQTAAEALGLPLSAIKTTVHRMRVEYRAKLREEIGRTLLNASEVDDELRHLRTVLAARAT